MTCHFSQDIFLNYRVLEFLRTPHPQRLAEETRKTPLQLVIGYKVNVYYAYLPCWSKACKLRTSYPASNWLFCHVCTPSLPENFSIDCDYGLSLRGYCNCFIPYSSHLNFCLMFMHCSKSSLMCSKWPQICGTQYLLKTATTKKKI